MDQTTLNLKFLTALNACETAKKFIKRNNLETFPVSMLDQIRGDHNDWVKWIKNKLNNVKMEFDSNNNLIHYEDSNGYEYWYEYDSNNNIIHQKNSNGYEYWYEYDSNNNLIHFKDSYGFEEWQEYDSNNNMIHYKGSNGYEHWKEYDSNGNMIHYKGSNGYEYWQEYDSNNNMINYKSSYGYEHHYPTEYYPNGQIKRYGNMILPELDNDSPTCYNNKTNGEVKMTNSTRKTTRYAVISRNTGKVLKNAPTREVARQWKRDSGKNGLGILDRNSGVIIS